MTRYLLPEEVGQAVVRYLATRPYGEVFELVQAIQKLEPVPPEKIEEPVNAAAKLVG